MTERCRMTTRAGVRCSREAEPGGLGFCWQHVPSSGSEGKWIQRIELIGVGLTAAEILIKIAEVAVAHLAEAFGSGVTRQSQAKFSLQRRFRLLYPDAPSDYDPGSRVDWIELQKLVQLADHLQHSASRDEEGAAELERRFDAWYWSLSDYHRDYLLRVIEGDGSPPMSEPG